jgi:hypothetical protein
MFYETPARRTWLSSLNIALPGHLGTKSISNFSPEVKWEKRNMVVASKSVGIRITVLTYRVTSKSLILVIVCVTVSAGSCVRTGYRLHFRRVRPLSGLEAGATVSSNNAERVAECSGSERAGARSFGLGWGWWRPRDQISQLPEVRGLITLVSQRRKPGRWNLDRSVLCRSVIPRSSPSFSCRIITMTLDDLIKTRLEYSLPEDISTKRIL